MCRGFLLWEKKSVEKWVDFAYTVSDEYRPVRQELRFTGNEPMMISVREE